MSSYGKKLMQQPTKGEVINQLQTEVKVLKGMYQQSTADMVAMGTEIQRLVNFFAFIKTEGLTPEIVSHIDELLTVYQHESMKPKEPVSSEELVVEQPKVEEPTNEEKPV